MTLGQDPFNPYRTLPTLSVIQRRRRELLTYQHRHEPAQALATPNQEETYEEAHLTQEQEEQRERQGNDDLQAPYAGEEPGPSEILPSRSSTPPRLAWPARPLTSTPEGRSRVQIRALFHRHVSKERIDLALEQLLSLSLINRATAAGRGRSASLWTKTQNPETGTNTLGTDPYGA
jgi:hypothetical protein